MSTLDTAVISAIDFYKSKLSGKYIFKNKVCSFRHETCSVYGKRIISEKGVKKGIHLIKQRLTRCRDYKLILFDNDVLAWDRGFSNILENLSEDFLVSSLDNLKEASETKESIGHILSGTQKVHAYLYEAPSELLTYFIKQEQVQNISPFVRKAHSYEISLQKRLLSRLGTQGTLFIPLSLLEIPSPILFSGAAIILTAAIKSYVQRMNFYENFAITKKII